MNGFVAKLQLVPELRALGHLPSAAAGYTGWRKPQQRQNALLQIQGMLKPQAGPLLDEFAEMLVDVPDDDLDREINNIGYILMLALKRTAPTLSEAMQFGLPFAFAEMLGERVRQSNV
jgi:hypothetical protein